MKPRSVGENVHVVQRRDRERRLEFPRQIRFAVERIDEILVRRCPRFNSWPSTQIGGRPWSGAAAPSTTTRASSWTRSTTGLVAGVGGAMTFRFTSPHAASVVASASLMPLISGPSVRLHDAVKLKALARCDAQRVVAVVRSELIESQVQVGADHAPGHSAAHHNMYFFPVLRRSRSSCW